MTRESKSKPKHTRSLLMELSEVDEAGDKLEGEASDKS